MKVLRNIKERVIEPVYASILTPWLEPFTTGKFSKEDYYENLSIAEEVLTPEERRRDEEFREAMIEEGFTFLL